MIFRVVNQERMPQVMDLWDYCFEKKEEPFFQWYFSQYCGKDNMVLGGFDEDDKLQNMLHINPYMLKIRGFEQLTPYIVGVATAPEARGQHLFAQLLETAFTVLRSQEFPFVLLMPVFAGIYQPYQFAYCYFRHLYDLELSKLTLGKSSSLYKIKRVPLEKTFLQEVYARVTANWHAVPVRTDFQWRKLLAVHNLERVQCAVVEHDSSPVGYMLYKITEGRFEVIELLTCDYEARQSLLNYAAQHKSEARRLRWLAEAWDTTYLRFKDQDVSGSFYPFMMARCIDARLALSKLTVPVDAAKGEITLLLTDNVIERNNHLLKLQISADGLEASSTMDNDDVAMDMAAFTQLYFGAFSVFELAEAGKIKVSNADKLLLLDKLLPKKRNYINEYF